MCPVLGRGQSAVGAGSGFGCAERVPDIEERRVQAELLGLPAPYGLAKPPAALAYHSTAQSEAHRISV